MSKPFVQMSEAELREEWHRWNEEIEGATSWGAALAVADEFRTDIALELRRRGLEMPK